MTVLIEVLGLQHTSVVCPPARRPVCQGCGRALSLRTVRFRAEEAQRICRESPQTVAWTRFAGPVDAPRWLDLWRGEYVGYGRDAQKRPLFCRLGCALNFAETLWLAGRRVELDGRLLDRE